MIVNKIFYKIELFVFLALFSSTVKCQAYENRTYAGKEISITAAPYTVHLKPVGCTGALIHRQWVLTAGHCIVDEIVSKIYAVLGASDSRLALYYIKVENAYLHPEYKKVYNDPEIGKSAKCDIALVKLERPAILSPFVQLLAMDTDDWPNVSSRTCTLAGYGNNIYGNTRLHSSKLHVETECGCLTNASVLCAVAFEKGDSPCYGDSGSIMVCDNKGVGVTSQATPHSYCYDKMKAVEELEGSVCGQTNFYYIFTKLQPNFFWFERVLRSHTSNRGSKLKSLRCQLYSSLQISTLLVIMLLHFCR